MTVHLSLSLQVVADDSYLNEVQNSGRRTLHVVFSPITPLKSVDFVNAVHSGTCPFGVCSGRVLFKWIVSERLCQATLYLCLYLGQMNRLEDVCINDSLRSACC